MSKLFIGCVVKSACKMRCTAGSLLTAASGLAWHTDDQTLRTKFEEYGQVDEAVSSLCHVAQTPLRTCFLLMFWADCG